MTTSALPLPESPPGAPPKRVPPGPRGKPFFGSVLEAWDDPLELMSQSTREHGDIVRFRFGWLQYFLLNSPDAAHRVLVENAKAYHKSPNYVGLKTMLGQGLLTSEGEYWRRQRKLSQPAFHRERIAAFVATMASCTEETVARWSELPTEGRVLDVHAEMMRLTFRIVGLTLLGADLEADARPFGEALNVAITWANEQGQSIVRLPPWVPTPRNVRFRRAQRLIEGVVMKVVEERRRSGDDPHDFLSLLMSVRDEATGEGLTDRQLLDELLTLTLAGHETTANALAFTFHLLSHHPAVARRVRVEADEVLGDRVPTIADLARMPFTKAVVEESLRLYPPAWIVERIALEDDVVGGYSVPKGSLIGVCAWTMHRHPGLWENPEGFDPERFLRPDASRPKLAYIPFGAGPRTCIGNMFALTELQVILPMIVRRFSLDIVPGAKLDLDPSITLRPRRGLPMVARPLGAAKPA